MRLASKSNENLFADTGSNPRYTIDFLAGLKTSKDLKYEWWLKLNVGEHDAW